MFKSDTIFRLGAGSALDLITIAQALEARTFSPCAPTQQLSAGFVPPRQQHGSMVESVGGQWVLKVKTETRTVPAQAIKRRVTELAAIIEQETGRKPGAKIRKELKEQALHDLLPQAFGKEAETLIWIDHDARLMVLDTASCARADLIVTLVGAIEGLQVSHLITEMSPAAAMTHWLAESSTVPLCFSIDRECELVSQDELRSVVRYGKHPLDIDNVREHIKAGKIARRLALTWRDRVSFVLTDAMQLRKLQFLDVVFEKSRDGEDDFDANVAILTGELADLLPDLVLALGGELRAEGGAA